MTDSANNESMNLLAELIDAIANPPPPPSKEELLALANKMNQLRESVYWQLFASGIGGECHAFIEFCGVMSTYVSMCHAAAEAGIDFRYANTHNGKPLKMHAHQAKYLGEKLDCIFGPALRANPAAAKAFLTELGFARTSLERTLKDEP